MGSDWHYVMTRGSQAGGGFLCVVSRFGERKVEASEKKSLLIQVKANHEEQDGHTNSGDGEVVFVLSCGLGERHLGIGI